MKKTAVLLLFAGFCVFFGCVSKAKYENAIFGLEQSNLAQSRIKQENDKLAAEVKDLEYRNAYLKSAAESYEDRIATLEKYIMSSKKIQNKMISEIALIRQNLQNKLNIKDLEIKALRGQNYKLMDIIESQTNQSPKEEILQK